MDSRIPTTTPTMSKTPADRRRRGHHQERLAVYCLGGLSGLSASWSALYLYLSQAVPFICSLALCLGALAWGIRLSRKRGVPLTGDENPLSPIFNGFLFGMSVAFIVSLALLYMAVAAALSMNDEPWFTDDIGLNEGGAAHYIIALDTEPPQPEGQSGF